MSEFSFKLPDLGEGIVESEIVEWQVQLGDVVEEDQHIVDVMTDKAVVEVTAPVAGVVVKLACAAGEVLAVGAQLILFATSDHDEAVSIQVVTSKDPEPAIVVVENPLSPTDTTVAEEAPPTQLAAATNTDNHRQILTSPSVRHQARSNHVDLGLVTGTGPAGRISNSDLNNFIAAGGMQVNLPKNDITPKNTGTTALKITGLRRVIGQKMLAATQNIPHYSYIEEIDLTALEDLRKHLNDHRQVEQTKLTLLPFIMQALVKVLADFPACNAHYDDNAQILTQHQGVHIGIATMTEKGLLVPVVKHSESLDIWQCAAQLVSLAQVCREGTAKQDQLISC